MLKFYFLYHHHHQCHNINHHHNNNNDYNNHNHHNGHHNHHNHHDDTKAKEAGSGDKSKSSKGRTPSFNIRRRTRSFKDKYKLPENLGDPDLQAVLDRKQELQAGGKKAAVRSWKNFYTVLYRQLLAFFKDKEG